MACSLKLSPTADVDFVGPKDASVTITLTASAGADAQILHIRYAGTPVTQPPFKFTIQEGIKKLVVLAEASQAGALLELREDCGGTSQVLETFHFDPENPALGFFVKGS